MLTQERLKELLRYDPDTGIFYRKISPGGKYKVGEKAGCLSCGYVIIKIDQILYRAHRLAWFYVYGVWPDSEIDHVNGIRNDNRLSNLRDVTPQVNRQNQHRAQKSNKLGLLGVDFHKGKYRATITLLNGKQKHVGYFETPEQAHDAYLRTKREIHEGNTL